MAELSPQEKELLLKYCENPVTFAENLISLPAPHVGRFKANFGQRKILMSEKSHVAICCHRRLGKSTALLLAAIFSMVTRERCQILFLAPDQSKIENFFEEFDAILNANPWLSGMKARAGNTNNPYRRKFNNQSRMWGFVCKNGSDNVRSQSADIVIIDEADFIEDENWKAINPIIWGDKYRERPKLYAASTPNDNPKSRFLRWFSKDYAENTSDYTEEGEEDSTVDMSIMETVFIPITKNPLYSEDDIAEIRHSLEKDGKLDEFRQEYLLEYVSTTGDKVFKKHQVDYARKLPGDGPTGYTKTVYELPEKSEKIIRVLGVDWDRVQAGPSILILDWIVGTPELRVVWREEIDKNKQDLFWSTCQYIIDLYPIVKYDHLMMEATRDTPQVETMIKLAREQRPAALKTIESIDFNSKYVTYDYLKREQIKRYLKPVIVGNLQTLFEKQCIFYGKNDTVLNQQLTDYRVVGYTERGPRYSKRDEHFIDCLGMCAFAIYKHYNNPLAEAPAKNIVNIPMQDVNVPSSVYRGIRAPRVNGYQEPDKETRELVDRNRFSRSSSAQIRSRGWSNAPLRRKF